jgi:hypothetical protein
MREVNINELIRGQSFTLRHGKLRLWSTAIFALICLCRIPTAAAQIISAGVNVGVQPTAAFSVIRPDAVFRTQQYYSISSHPVAIGPAVLIHLPMKLAAHGDVLRKEISYTLVRYAPLTTETRTTTGRSWTYSQMVTREVVDLRGVRGFLGAGAAARHVRTGTEEQIVFVGRTASSGEPVPATIGQIQTPELVSAWAGGIVATTGVGTKWDFMEIRPELRYTRWLDRNFQSPPGPAACLCERMNSRQDELYLSLTFTFGIR